MSETACTGAARGASRGRNPASAGAPMATLQVRVGAMRRKLVNRPDDRCREADMFRRGIQAAVRREVSPSRTRTEVTSESPKSTTSDESWIRLDDVIDAAEAARLLGVGREHVVKLLQQGRLRGKRLTATWVTTRQAAQAYAQNRRPRGRPRTKRD